MGQASIQAVTDHGLRQQAAAIIERAEAAGHKIYFMTCGSESYYGCGYADGHPPHEYLRAVAQDTPLQRAIYDIVRETRHYVIKGEAA